MAQFVLSFFLLAAFAWYGQPAKAQGPTDLYLFQIRKSTDHRYHVYQPKFLSGFNPGGYTNQPWFTSEGDILVSVKMDGGTQYDIYQLSLKKISFKQLTRTYANEFSPRMRPDGKHLTVVRQIEGDIMDQQVYQFSLQDKSYKSLIPGARDVGYYTWLTDHDLGLFQIEGGANRLVYHTMREPKSQRVTTAVGCSLHTDGKGAILYVHKFADEHWYIKRYNPTTSAIDIIAETPAGAEDFVRAADGTYFIGQGTKLFSLHPDYHTEWQEILDLSIYGIKHITRLALSPDGRQLALVDDRKE